MLQQAQWRDPAHLQLAFDRWRQVYNHDRPHEALELAVPASRYEPSLRAYPEILPPIEYDTGVTVRKVQQKGEVHFQGQVFEVSRAFRGYPVGLVPTKEDGSMTYASVTIQLRGLMYVNITNQSVTYVSGTFVTLDSGLNKGG